MGMDKNILSSQDLKLHADQVAHWGPQDLVKALLADGFEAKLKHPFNQTEEDLHDLICFGSKEVLRKLIVFFKILTKLFTNNATTLYIFVIDIISIKARHRVAYWCYFNLDTTDALPVVGSSRSDGS